MTWYTDGLTPSLRSRADQLDDKARRRSILRRVRQVIRRGLLTLDQVRELRDDAAEHGIPDADQVRHLSAMLPARDADWPAWRTP